LVAIATLHDGIGQEATVLVFDSLEQKSATAKSDLRVRKRRACSAVSQRRRPTSVRSSTSSAHRSRNCTFWCVVVVDGVKRVAQDLAADRVQLDLYQCGIWVLLVTYLVAILGMYDTIGLPMLFSPVIAHVRQLFAMAIAENTIKLPIEMVRVRCVHVR
jgi:hypothetical protein